MIALRALIAPLRAALTVDCAPRVPQRARQRATNRQATTPRPRTNAFVAVLFALATTAFAQVPRKITVFGFPDAVVRRDRTGTKLEARLQFTLKALLYHVIDESGLGVLVDDHVGDQGAQRGPTVGGLASKLGTGV